MPTTEADKKKIAQLLEDLGEPGDEDEIVVDEKPDPVLAKAKSPQHISVDMQMPDNPHVLSGGDGDKTSNLPDEIMGQFSAIQGEIWDAIKNDRKLIDKYIELWADRASDAEMTKQCYVEAITSLLTTKATTSMNATRLLDSFSKMLSTLKNMKIENEDNKLGDLLDESPIDGFDPNEP